jgi:hypothetical protein
VYIRVRKNDLKLLSMASFDNISQYLHRAEVERHSDGISRLLIVYSTLATVLNITSKNKWEHYTSMIIRHF